MRKVSLILSLLLLVACTAGAKAAELPGPIAALFDTPSWEGWEVAVVDSLTAAGTESMAAAVVMKRGERNVLCFLDREDGGWAIRAASAGAAHQGDMLPALDIPVMEDSAIAPVFMRYEHASGDTETYMWVYIERRPVHLESAEFSYVSPAGIRYESRSGYYRAYATYSLSGEVGGEALPIVTERHYANYHRFLANIDFASFPHDYESALAAIPPVERVQEGEQLDPLPPPRPVRLGQAVSAAQAGPGDRYAPAEAMALEAGDAVYAIAAEGNFVLIARQDGPSTEQYGYVPYHAIENPEDIPEASFAYLSATLLNDTELLSGPGGISRAPLAKDLRVRYLATLGSDWSFVETIGAEPARGFVPSASLRVQYDMDVPEGHGSAGAIMLRDALVIDEPYRTAHPQTVATVFAGTKVAFYDTLYGEWACIDVFVDDGDTTHVIRGYVPRDAISSTISAEQLEGNG